MSADTVEVFKKTCTDSKKRSLKRFAAGARWCKDHQRKNLEEHDKTHRMLEGMFSGTHMADKSDAWLKHTETCIKMEKMARKAQKAEEVNELVKKFQEEWQECCASSSSSS